MEKEMKIIWKRIKNGTRMNADERGLSKKGLVAMFPQKITQPSAKHFLWSATRINMEKNKVRSVTI